MERLICLIMGYLFGSLLQAGYWFGKLHHIDIRKYGSGNAGTTNVMRTLGKKAGYITYTIDACKVIFPAILIHFIFAGNAVPEMLLSLYCGFGAVLGHNFPFYLNFKGGKGIAASSGVILSLMLFPVNCWLFTVLGFIIFMLVTFTSKYVSLGSLTLMFTFCVEFIIWGCFGLLPVTGTFLYEADALVILIAALAFFRHRANIGRLIHGTERKIGQKKG